MTPQTNGFWYFLVGAGFIGFWLYVATFASATPDGWLLWGLLGIAIAAAFYVGRLANEQVRVGIWIVTGLFLGFLVAAAFFEGEPMILATFITGVGAGLIAAGLPPHQAPATSAAPTPPPAAEPAYTTAPAYQQQPAPPTWGRGGQQQQQGVTVYGPEYR